MKVLVIRWLEDSTVSLEIHNGDPVSREAYREGSVMFQ